MGFITSTISNLLVSQPQGMWEFFIFGLDNVIKNYGLTIILITLIIKVIMLPFDFFNRYVSKKNASKMAVIQPEIEKIQKRYGNNKDLVNQKTMEVYKKHNYSVTGSCLIMVVNLAVTMTIFFTLFTGLNQIAAYKTATEFEQLKAVYETQVGGTLVETPATETTPNKVQISLSDGSVVDLTEEQVNLANTEVIKTYGEIKSGFLWIKNIWRPDTSASVTLSYKDYLSISKTKAEELPEAIYNQILTPIKNDKQYSGWNGYYILIILSALSAYLSTQINVWIGKAKAQKQGKPYVDAMAQNKIMVYLMPIIMAMFALFYNSMFAIYMVTGSLFGMAVNPLITLLVDMLYEKSEEKEKEKVLSQVSYSRKNVSKQNNSDVKVKNAKIVKDNKENKTNKEVKENKPLLSRKEKNSKNDKKSKE